jgi:hypothetical protein
MLFDPYLFHVDECIPGPTGCWKTAGSLDSEAPPRFILALTPAARSLSVRSTLEYMRRFDPQHHSGFALEQRIFVAPHVLLGEHVDVLDRSLVGTTLLNNGSADHNAPPRIIRIDDRDRDPWVSIDVARLEMTHDRIDKDMGPIWFDIHPYRRCLWRSIGHDRGDDG